MKVIYDPGIDVLSILFSTESVSESSEGKPGVIIDYDKEGNLVSLMITAASIRIENPRSLEFAVWA